MSKLTFEKWFNKVKQMDIRMPINCKLTFVEKLSTDEWKELIAFIYKKVKEEKEE